MKHLLNALVIVILICVSARGEEVTFGFRGTVHELDGEFSYFSGHPFEITYSFETATDDSSPGDDESGIYIGAIMSGTLTIFTDNGTIEWIVEPDGHDNIIEVKNSFTTDSYTAGASVSGSIAGVEIPAYFRIELMDRDSTALNTDALPPSLDIRSFDRSVVELTFIGTGQSVSSTFGIITSCTAPVSHAAVAGTGFPDGAAPGAQ
jgi:hypothetical protein